MRRPVSRSAPFYRLFSASNRLIEFRLGLIDSIKVQLCVATGPPWRYLAMVDTIADLRLTQMLREPREVVMSTYGKTVRMVMEDSDRMEWNQGLRMISEWFCRFAGGNKIFTFMNRILVFLLSMFIQFQTFEYTYLLYFILSYSHPFYLFSILSRLMG